MWGLPVRVEESGGSKSFNRRRPASWAFVFQASSCAASLFLPKPISYNWYYIRILSNIARLAQALGVVDLLWVRTFEGQLCSALFMVAQIAHALNARLERCALLWRSAFHRCAHILLWLYTTSSSAWGSLATQSFCFPLKSSAKKFSPLYYWYTQPVDINSRTPAMNLEGLRFIKNPDPRGMRRPFEYLIYSAKELKWVLNCSKAAL